METPAELIRNTDFWFKDGTIVLQVENTLYRLYHGLLASRSSVFHDTFSIPQPAEEGKHVEACPVVQLHGQSEDFTRFLKALLQYGPNPNCSVVSFPELRSILQLSDKYDVPILRDGMIALLLDLYPTSLDKWTARRTPPGYNALVIDDFEALNMAVKINIRPILPSLMYDICTSKSYGLDAIVFGYETAKIEDDEYRKRCIAAIPQLVRAQRKVLAYLRDGMDTQYDDDTGVDPLADTNEMHWDHYAVCPPCLAAAKTAYQEARQELWDDLPDIFNLGTWDELLA
ncbi:hypothetical protein C8R43DRAFT_1116697 [Mycena crocata]|nr:hypothetical protein C8R43DRAFT_1116697 [Mycena crocata]